MDIVLNPFAFNGTFEESALLFSTWTILVCAIGILVLELVDRAMGYWVYHSITRYERKAIRWTLFSRKIRREQNEILNASLDLTKYLIGIAKDDSPDKYTLNAIAEESRRLRWRMKWVLLKLNFFKVRFLLRFN